MTNHVTGKQFVDLEIRIFPRQDEGYPVELVLGGEEHFPRGHLDGGILPWVCSADPVADGQRLVISLFSDGELRSAWTEARGQAPQRRIRLWIDRDAAELHALPWELLWEGHVMLAAQDDTPFSRYLPIEPPWGGPVTERPIRALAVISDPSDLTEKYGLPRADVARERESLASAFATVDPRHLQVEFLETPATLEKLENRLRDGGYHILHLLGHGAYSEDWAQAVLYMQDEEGLTRLVSENELAQMLARMSVPPCLVFLAACQTATRSTTDAFLGMAPKLVSAGVPAVVAMQGLVAAESALKFGTTFYGRLLAHGQVDLAANEARSTLLTAGRPAAAVPVLFMRLKSGRLWEAAEVPDAEYRPLPPPDPGVLPDPGPLPPGYRLPFHRNFFFTGRLLPLLDLGRGLLHDGAGTTLVTRAVQGMGGVGKTQLAVEFAHRYGRFFHSVHWINAAQPAVLAAEVAACGESMGLPDWPSEQPEQVTRTLSEWQGGGPFDSAQGRPFDPSQDRPRLVILDDLEDVGAAREWLARLSGGAVRVLLTARRSDWPIDIGLEPLRLDLFSPDESRAFLRRYLPEERASDANLNRLAGWLGHLPLALELAGRYLHRVQHLTVAGYLDKLENIWSHPSMQGWRKERVSPTGHDLDLLAAFGVSWEQVEDEGARHVFLLAGYCAPNQPIPCELLEQAAGLETEACDRVLDALVGLGLLAMEDPERGPTVHPLLAEYGRCQEMAPAQLPGLTSALARLAREANDRMEETGSPSHFLPLLPHVRLVAEAAEAAEAGEKETAENAANLWKSLGYHLRRVASLAEAREAFERAMRIGEAVYGPDHPDVAIDVNNLGGVLKDLGDLAGAREAYERAMRIDEVVYGPDHPKVAIRVNNLGRVLQDLGELAGAREAYERALRIWQAAYGEEHPQVATAHSNLGGVLRALGDLAGARAAYERALGILEGLLPPDHPYIKTVRGNLEALG
jgi:tetratricopeptide (TPR) repeat protein